MKEISVRPLLCQNDSFGKPIGEITGDDAKAYLYVNVASKSILTDRNYKQLVQIDNEYK